MAAPGGRHPRQNDQLIHPACPSEEKKPCLQSRLGSGLQEEDCFPSRPLQKPSRRRMKLHLLMSPDESTSVFAPWVGMKKKGGLEVAQEESTCQNLDNKWAESPTDKMIMLTSLGTKRSSYEGMCASSLEL